MAGDLVLIDFLDLKQGNIAEGAPNAAGVAQQQYQCPADQYWLIDSMAILTNSAAASTLRIYVGGPGQGSPPIPVDEDLIDGSLSGNEDVSDRASPIRVFPGSYLTFRWTGLTVGSIAKLHAQGRILKRRIGRR